MLNIGAIFNGPEELKAAMQKNLGIMFPQKGWIPHIPVSPDSREIRHPNIGAAKHNFYNIDFFPTGRWNEFDGVSKAETWENCLDVDWIHEKTNVIHEILSPLANPEMPGAESRYHYEPFFDLFNTKKKESTQRLIFGQFNGLPNSIYRTYIFLGLYEYDKSYYNISPDEENIRKALNNCENVEPYKIDEDSFPINKMLKEMDANPIFQPSDQDAIRSGLIVYKHQVWKRIANQWPLEI